jgi:hypothetical protein
MTLTAKLKWIQRRPIVHQKSRTNHKENDKTIKKSWRKRLWPPTHWFRRHRSNLKTSHCGNANQQENHSSSYSEKIIPKISKTTITIKFEVNNINGVLLFNIPSIPSDRIWISFLDMPEIEFSV